MLVAFRAVQREKATKEDLPLRQAQSVHSV